MTVEAWADVELVQLLTGVAALLLSFVPSLTGDSLPYLLQPDALYLALFGLLNLAFAALPEHAQLSNRRPLQILASVLLIALPTALGIARQGNGRPIAASRGRVVIYFLAIGFAFMFIEIAFIQKFVLYLSHPLYAVAVVLFAFLLFAGIGSAVSKRLQDGVPRTMLNSLASRAVSFGGTETIRSQIPDWSAATIASESLKTLKITRSAQGVPWFQYAGLRSSVV